jgi:ADP-heptose:LPS heptosyltransferase
MYKKILIIKLGAFGDLILMLGAIEKIRAYHPEAQITLMTTAPFVALAQTAPYFDRVWEIKRWTYWNFRSWLRFVKKLRRENYDCVYDLQRNDRTRIFYHLSPPALQKNWFGDKPPKDTRALSIMPDSAFPPPDLSWMDADIAPFHLPEKFVLLVVGCAPQHPKKRWPITHYAEVAKELLQRGYTPVVLGTKSEAAIIEQLTQTVPEVVSLLGKTTFMHIAALARTASGAVGNDTGPMHLIALAGCPSVSLFSGETNAAQSAPKGKNVTVLQSDPIEDITVLTVLETLLKSMKA